MSTENKGNSKGIKDISETLKLLEDKRVNTSRYRHNEEFPEQDYNTWEIPRSDMCWDLRLKGFYTAKEIVLRVKTACRKGKGLYQLYIRGLRNT